MRAVLGIDAAWTTTQPSGVALLAETGAGWRLIAVASSYQRFRALGDPSLAAELRPLGSPPDAGALLAAAAALCGRAVDLVAIDMPLSRQPITGRRPSDNAVSRAFGGVKCSTHSPSAQRPGPISDRLTAGFAALGYRLQTLALTPPGLIEVYPHPALVFLAGAPERLRYKVAKAGRYWPDLTPRARRDLLFEQWGMILALLDGEIGGVTAALPAIAADAPGVALKAYEDMLDAVVCGFVAICALDGRASPFGDFQSAIWVPVRKHGQGSALDPLKAQP